MFLTAFSIRVSLLGSKIYNGDGTAKDGNMESTDSHPKTLYNVPLNVLHFVRPFMFQS